MIDSIFHFNINCRNLEKSLLFYQMLGFKIVLDFREGMSSQEMAEAFSMKIADLKGVHLQLGTDESNTRIDLLEFKAPQPVGEPYPHLAHTGVARICLKTTDIQADYENLKLKGVKFLSSPKQLPSTDVSIVCFTDPDGIFLELLQGAF
jgi:glyoxylase I family protein